MEQNRKDYIVIRRPANNLGKPIWYFVPTHAEELTARYDEHDMQPVEAGDGLPAGTYTTFYRCRLIAADGGWYGEILGNGSW